MGIENVNGVNFGLAGAPQEASLGSQPIVPASAFDHNDSYTPKKKGLTTEQEVGIGAGALAATAVGIRLHKGNWDWLTGIFKKEGSKATTPPGSSTTTPPASSGRTGSGGGGGRSRGTGSGTGTPPVSGGGATRRLAGTQRSEAHRLLNSHGHIKAQMADDNAFQALHGEISRLRTPDAAAKFLKTHSSKFVDKTHAAQKATTDAEIARLTADLKATTDVKAQGAIRKQLTPHLKMKADLEAKETAALKELENAFGLERANLKPDTVFDPAVHGHGPNVKYSLTTNAAEEGKLLGTIPEYKDAAGNLVGDVKVGVRMPGLKEFDPAHATDGLPTFTFDKAKLISDMDSQFGIKLGGKPLDHDGLIKELYKKRDGLKPAIKQNQFDALLKSHGVELKPATLADGAHLTPAEMAKVKASELRHTDDAAKHGTIAEVIPSYVHNGNTVPERVVMHIHPETAKLNIATHKTLAGQVVGAGKNNKITTEMAGLASHPGQAKTEKAILTDLGMSGSLEDSRNILDTMLKDGDAKGFLKQLKMTTLPGEQSETLNTMRQMIKTADYPDGRLMKQFNAATR